MENQVYVLADILAKEPDQLTEGEIANLKSEVGSLSEDQLQKFASVLNPGGEENTEAGEQTADTTGEDAPADGASDETATDDQAAEEAKPNLAAAVVVAEGADAPEGHFAHTVTQEDLDANPELASSLTVGEVVYIPNAEEKGE